MSGQRPISGTAETVIPFAPNATHSVRNSKILLLVTFAALLVLVAVPILFRADMPLVTASSTLKCYDSVGNHEPCSMRASASSPRFNGRTIDPHQPPGWTAAALYQPASWTTTTVHQPASWTTTALHQPANGTTTAPAAGRSSTPGRSAGLATCRQRLIPCFFSTLRRRLTHIASVAAIVGRAL